MAAQVWAVIFAVVGYLIPPIKRLWVRGDQLMQATQAASEQMRSRHTASEDERRFLEVLRQQRDQ